MKKKNKPEIMTPTLIPSLRATLLSIPVGQTRILSCDDFSYTHIQSEASKLTSASKDKGRHKMRMFSASSADKGRTITVTRNW